MSLGAIAPSIHLLVHRPILRVPYLFDAHFNFYENAFSVATISYLFLFSFSLHNKFFFFFFDLTLIPKFKTGLCKFPMARHRLQAEYNVAETLGYT